MSDTISYAKTKVILNNQDGKHLGTYEVGQGVKLFDGLFGNGIVLGFSDVTKYGDIFVKVARPHCDAVCAGTTHPNVAVQVEVFGVTLQSLLQDNDGKGAFYKLDSSGGRTMPTRKWLDSEIVEAEVQQRTRTFIKTGATNHG
jgi:hypothetical protein